MADDEPRVLGNRYEITKAIARGGMARVYLARDRSLDRPVAVKELVPEFAADESFVERFRREAQAAANLTHPNIVGVYDWGTQDSTYFIIMEYVDGPVLSKVLRDEGPLHPRRAAELASEVAAALGFAHSRGVVHRDVKPGNVILTSSGQAKVTDFGIARAMSAPEENLTQAGSVMGTATYFSPEQAQGLAVDQRSDLYSLGVVLFEMVTGRTPFTGDTPLAIAYKHVQDQPPAPSTLVSGLPSGLEAVIMKLLRKRPEDRYANAEDLRADLRRFLNGQATLAEQERAAAVGTPTSAVAATAAAAAPEVAPSPAVEEPEPVDEEQSRTGMYLGILVVLLVILAGVLFWFARSLGDGGKVEVPAVIGLTKDEATSQLNELGFKVLATEEPSDTIEAGRVLSQNPGPGTKLDKAETVKIAVSTGIEKIGVPDVVGKTQDEAVNELSAAGLRAKITTAEDPNAAEGTVASQVPAAGEQVQKDAEVTITISKGKGEEIVPDVEGQPLAAAQQALQAAGFRIGGPKRAASSTVPAGDVISTDPPGGSSVKTGSVVTLTVSTGVEQVTVPSVIGQQESTATSTLSARGFDVNVVTTPVSTSSGKVGRVTAQTPAGGGPAPSGSTVTITVGIAAPTTTVSTTTTTTTTPTP
ncbi:MAG: Stk1 family PASTA domain-containing Ser/Thr kinase [Actinomycetes bacterium]